MTETPNEPPEPESGAPPPPSDQDPTADERGERPGYDHDEGRAIEQAREQRGGER